MKLQNEVQFAVNKVNELISRKSLASVKKYMAEVYEAHEWKNFEVRISNDIVKYAAIGIAETSALIERNPGTTDEHITTLCIAVMKKCGLLPFNPDKPADECDDFCPLTGCTLTDDGQGHLTPEEIKKIANETRKSNAHKYAEKLSKAADETLNNLFGTTDRVKILTNAHELTEAEARELLAEVKDEKAPTSDEKGDTGTTTPADECEAVTSEEKAPEGESLTPEAVAVVEKIQKSPRRVCLFDTFAELYEVKTKAEADGLHKWQALTACGVYREGRDTLATIARMITGDDDYLSLSTSWQHVWTDENGKDATDDYGSDEHETRAALLRYLFYDDAQEFDETDETVSWERITDVWVD